MTQGIISEYSDVFSGVGKFKDCAIKLNIDESVVPVSHKHRRIPFHTRPKEQINKNV